MEKPLLGPNLNPSVFKTFGSSSLSPVHAVPVLCALQMLRELAGNYQGGALFYKRKNSSEILISCLKSHSKLRDPPGRFGEAPMAPGSTLGPTVTLQVCAPGRCRATGGSRGQNGRGEGRSSRRGKPVHPDRMHRHAGAPGPTSCQRGHPSPPWGRKPGARWRGVEEESHLPLCPLRKIKPQENTLKRGVKRTSSNRAQQSRETSLWGWRAGLALGAGEARGPGQRWGRGEAPHPGP